MGKAVFLDRDGVLCMLVFNPATGEYEPPHKVKDLKLFPEAITGLKKLQNAGYELFLVSNQPDFAKGKSTLTEIEKVHAEFDRLLSNGGIRFKEYYYCHHHPKSSVWEFSEDCECRKPKPFFLFKAAKDHGVDLASSWMIGDRDTDIECGSSAGTRTILLEDSLSAGMQGKMKPSYKTKSFGGAVEIIDTLDSNA